MGNFTYVESLVPTWGISTYKYLLQFPKQTLFFFRDRIKLCEELVTVFLSYFALKGDNCFC
jgi:hypothetical protein